MHNVNKQILLIIVAYITVPCVVIEADLLKINFCLLPSNGITHSSQVHHVNASEVLNLRFKYI